MVSFPVFQSQGPNVNTSLFGDAAKTGAALGKAIPDTFTSVVQGGVEGFKTGQEFALNSINIDKAQAQADIAQSQDRIQQATEGSQIIATKDILQAKAKNAEQDLNLSNMQDQFFSEMQGASPQQQANIVLGGKYAQVFAADPKLFNEQLQQIYSDPSNGVNESTRQRIGDVLKVHQATDYRSRQAQAYLDKFNGAKQNLLAEDYIGQAVQQLGGTPEEAAQDIQLVPHGKYTYEGGSVVPDIKSGGWAANPKYDPSLYKGSYDAISRSTGQVIDGTGSINAASYKNYNNYITTKGMVDGSYLNRDISTINADAAKRSSPGTGNVNLPGFRSQVREEQAPPSNALDLKGPEYEIGSRLARFLHLDPDTYTSAARGSLLSLKSQVVSYVNDPSSRGSAEFLKSHTDTVNTLSRAATDTMFKASPVLQAQYTDSQVKSYNEALLGSLRKNFKFSVSNVLSGGVPSSELADAFSVNTPEDLYYVKQRPVVEAQINKYINDLISNLESQRNASGKSQISANGNISLVAGVAQNGPSGQ